jgi:mannose-6-phosphate isomerase-like protein (cupin superfamily)
MTWHAHLDSFASLLPGVPTDVYPEGEPFRTAMATGTMSVELFAPKGVDRQQPHTQDELYVVARGTSTFVRDGQEVAVATGSVLFVPAGMAHHFRDHSDDFATWVIFWGPSGGERCDSMNTGFPMAIVPPPPLRTGDFVFEPLAPRHNERDHIAWMSSIDHIRATPGFTPEWTSDRGGDDWPFEMPLASNLDDLQRHADEFGRGEAFAYSVLDHHDQVIGCVYINSDRTHNADAVCRMWVRASHAHLDGALFTAVESWLAGDEWPFATVRYPGRH